MYVLVYIIAQLLAAWSHFYLRPFILSELTKSKRVKMVTFAANAPTEKKGTNISTAKRAQESEIALLLLRKTKALEVRTRCENAAAMMTQGNSTRTPKKAVTIRDAAKAFKISHSQLFRYVYYVVLLYYILFYTEDTVYVDILIFFYIWPAI